MKNKSLFPKIILVIIVTIVCILSTVGISLLAGAIEKTIFDFSNINFANMIPVLLIGLFVSCVIIGIMILFIGKDAIVQVYDYYKKTNNSNGGKNQ